MKAALNDPLVIAARNALEEVWCDLGKPSPLQIIPEMEAARRVYHAVLDEADKRWANQRKKLTVIAGKGGAP